MPKLNQETPTTNHALLRQIIAILFNQFPVSLGFGTWFIAGRPTLTSLTKRVVHLINHLSRPAYIT